MFNEICTIIHFRDLIGIFQNVYKMIIKELGKNFLSFMKLPSTLSNMSFAWPEFRERFSKSQLGFEILHLCCENISLLLCVEVMYIDFFAPSKDHNLH